MTRQVHPKVRNTLDHGLPLPRSVAPVLLAMTLMAVTSVLAAGNDAKGTIAYKSRTTTVKYAYLVKGPDVVSKQPIRRLILSATDLGAKIATCKTMSCTDGDLGDGLSVNVDGSARLNYWMVQNDQRVQYSGTEPVASLAPINGVLDELSQMSVAHDAGEGRHRGGGPLHQLWRAVVRLARGRVAEDARRCRRA
jgi:hypothetical protein